MKRKSVPTTEPMKRSYLVQRLKTPWKRESTMTRLSDAFSFGGGLVNGGLSKDAMNLLRDIFRFDYMGSAEFEWGAVPAALNVIANNHDRYKAFQFTIDLATVARSYKNEKDDHPTGTATIYVLCNQAHVEEVEARIRTWASEPYNRNLKEDSQLPRALRPVDDYDRELLGWLELSNGFFFFTDPAMFEETAKLFGIKVVDK